MDKKGFYKRKNNNFHNTKRRKAFILEPGLKGFLCTHNGREKDCIKESYNILNDYVDKLNSSEYEADSIKEESSDEIEDALEKEIANHNPNKTQGPRKFQVVDTGTKGCLFIKTTLENPVDLAHEIMEDIDKSKQLKARYLLRLVPIEVTCKAFTDDIKKAADKLFDKHFRCEATTFAIVFNKRNNNSVLRDEIINSLALIVTDKNTNHKADLKQAKLSVIVEIMRSVCCLAVVPDYFKLRKYNIAELSKDVQTVGDDHQCKEVHSEDDICVQSIHEKDDTESKEGNLCAPNINEKEENEKDDVDVKSIDNKEGK